jgi:D-psicose/D-tagatose/L-ribulose 3-epimerase
MKYAVCNELFGGQVFQDACLKIASYGFEGVEIAPYTLAENPLRIGSEKGKEIKRIMKDTGLQFVGFHWLLSAPEGFHITTPETSTRRKSWDFMRYLVELCQELGGEILVLGSSKQRSTMGIPKGKALSYLKEGLKEIAPLAERGNIKVLIEPLPSRLTDVVNTLQGAKKIIEEVGSPAISGMFDFHNCEDENKPWHQLINEYFSIIEHVHLNEVDGDYPGSGNSDFLPTFRALREREYKGWISLEIFHFRESPDTILSSTRRVISEIETKLSG